MLLSGIRHSMSKYLFLLITVISLAVTQGCVLYNYSGDIDIINNTNADVICYLTYYYYEYNDRGQVIDEGEVVESYNVPAQTSKKELQFIWTKTFYKSVNYDRTDLGVEAVLADDPAKIIFKTEYEIQTDRKVSIWIEAAY